MECFSVHIMHTKILHLIVINDKIFDNLHFTKCDVPQEKGTSEDVNVKNQVQKYLIFDVDVF